VPGCRCYSSGLLRWRRRPPSARELADRKLAERIREIYAETEQIYGAPRIYSELKLADGIAVGKKRVARLMRQLGLRGVDGKHGGPRTTVRDPSGARHRTSSTAASRGRNRTGSGSVI